MPHSPVNSAADSSAAPPSPPPDEAAVNHLIDSERHHMPRPDFLRSIDLTSRQDSVNWILKVHSHYQFGPVTAFLSVNYLDRFLSSNSLPKANGWPFQLLAVACLSLAAKMEERYVPLLLDLQIFEPKFVFEPQTVQRMELWVMASLNWRLRSVTPFDYIDYFVSKLSRSGSESDFTGPVVAISSDLILDTLRVIDFSGFPPSLVAAAAVVAAARESADLPETFYERVNKEMVRSCLQLMEVYLMDTCPSVGHKDRSISEPPPPPSPDGVLDAAAACVSCDTRSENLVTGSMSGGSESREVGPQNKRLRSSASNI
ncbi:cyclin-D4-1-like isoform X2 [Rhododendron vialii]|uniref:cyclin-D4-1-like isoform X2 n=1 Tax=Rhododendron vialii TaxID=182163 RepID=UPI00265FDE94|nr:cyclin-D4-1-like isoform X2 [Rhododendron vialii]